MGVAEDGSATTVHVLFGTVTGNAEEIACRVHAELPTRGFRAGLLRSLRDYKDVGLSSAAEAKGNAYIIVCSTTGDGDAPDPIRPFMRLLRKKEPTLLAGVPYTVLGLGDTNYENFCQAAKKVDVSLAKLGAERFYKRGQADDGTGLEEVVEPWLDGLWPALKDRFGDAVDILADKEIACGEDVESTTTVSVDDIVKAVTAQELGFDETSLPSLLPAKISVAAVIETETHFDSPLSVSASYDPETVRKGSVSAARKLTADDALKTVWHMEVAFDNAIGVDGSYSPGDAFGILVDNDVDEISRLLAFVSVDGEDVVRIVAENGSIVATASARQLLTQRVDIRAIPKKTFLRALSEHCSDVEERRYLLTLCSRTSPRLYSERILKKNMSLLGVLEELAPSCRPPLALLLDQLPPLPPRWYSATSSPEVDGTSSLHFAFSVVEGGLATTALASRCEAFTSNCSPAAVLVMPRQSDANSYFRPPSSLSQSYVMVGPGTGVAPFRGFLRERAAQLERVSVDIEKVGSTMLFFGCREAEKDYLYREDLEHLSEMGVLGTLDVAFSRSGPSKIYVQDRIQALGAAVAEMVQDGGSIFVCGDGGGMAVGVDKALTAVLSEHCCDGNEKDAKVMLKKMAAEHRYVRDIWYFGEANA